MLRVWQVNKTIDPRKLAVIFKLLVMMRFSISLLLCSLFLPRVDFSSTARAQEQSAAVRDAKVSPPRTLPGLDEFDAQSDLPTKKPQASVVPKATKSTGEEAKQSGHEVLRVLSPGVFDVKAGAYMVRFRAWGVGFPKREQPGFREALRYTEEQLLGVGVELELKREFDADNLKLVEVRPVGGSVTFSRNAILSGHGWHIEKETGRYGPFSIAQMKAKRMNLGVWRNPLAYGDSTSASPLPQPKLPGALFRQDQQKLSGSPARISFWVSSLGKVHRPGCAFYRKGRGLLTNAPQGYDCRICGGKVGKPRK